MQTQQPSDAGTMGLRYIVWHSASEKPARPIMPRRPYLGWLHSGVIAYGVPEVVYWDQAGHWQPFHNPALQLSHWADIPRPSEAGPAGAWQGSDGDGP